jgi:hypothetical protein
MTDRPQDSDPLESVLSDAEDELRRRLREACEAEERGVSTESTQEIRRLEDSLLAAAVAAQQTVLVRRHMRERARPDGDREAESGGIADRAIGRLDEPPNGGQGDGAPEEPSTVVREFTDTDGRNWRAWQVTPRVGRSGGPASRILGTFQEGWICFESLDSTARRRLAPHHPRWAELSEGELRDLLRRASAAPLRRAGSAPREATIRAIEKRSEA